MGFFFLHLCIFNCRLFPQLSTTHLVIAFSVGETFQLELLQSQLTTTL